MSRVGYASLSEADRKKYRLEKGDILFSHINSAIHVGKTATFDIDEDVYHGVNLLLMRPKPEVASGFLNMYLKHLFEMGYWRTRCKQSVNQASVNQQDINRVPIRYPQNHSEQRRIVTILDEALENIATAKSNAEKNLQNAHEVFEGHVRSMFSRLSPVSEDLQLGELCEFVRGPFGGSLTKSNFVSDGYAVYEQQHAIYDQFDEVRYFVGEAKFNEMKRFELHPGELIMSCSGTMGRVAIVPKGIRKGIINQALLKLSPMPSVLNSYLKYWMTSEGFQNALSEYSGGAAIQNVASVKVLKEIRVPLPSLEEQSKAVESIDSMFTEIERLETLYQQKIETLGDLKQSLLHRAFNGDL